MAQDMTIGELSRRSGCPIDTIRYYEKIRLIPAPPRFGRFRSYGTADLDRIVFIRQARELGFRLEAVKMLLSLARPGPECCAKVRDIAETHLESIRSRVADLLRVQATLTDAVKGCEKPVDGMCPVLDAINRTRCKGQMCDGAATEVAAPLAMP
jgi:MerR family mercuric resistance operon transcriptional regulator